MFQDLYELLEVPDNATNAWIRRAYDSRRKAVAQDASLSQDQRQAQLQAVEHAFGVLSNPETRSEYDQHILAVTAPVVVAKKRSTFSVARIAIWGTVLVVLAGTAIALWRHSQYEEQMRIEQERVAAELVARVKEMEARDKAQRESQSIKEGVEYARAKQEAKDGLSRKTQEEKTETVHSSRYDPH